MMAIIVTWERVILTQEMFIFVVLRENEVTNKWKKDVSDKDLKYKQRKQNTLPKYSVATISCYSSMKLIVLYVRYSRYSSYTLL